MGIFDDSSFLLLIKALTATKAVRDIFAVRAGDVLAKRIAHGWHAKYKNENFYLKEISLFDRAIKFGEKRLNQLLHKSSRHTIRELSEEDEWSHTAIEKHCRSAIQENKPNRHYAVLLLHENAPLHIANITRRTFTICLNGFQRTFFNLFRILCERFHSILIQN